MTSKTAEPVQIECGLSNTDSPENSLLRVMFTCFLNTGALDERMKAAVELKPQSARSDHVGFAFMALHSESIREEFLAWVQQDALARFIMDNDHTRDCIMQRFPEELPGTHGYWLSPVDVILGARFKEITGFDRARMPKDLKKSFYTKAANRLSKMVEEYGKLSPNQKWTLYDYDKGDYVGTTPSVEEWLRLALSDRNVHLPSKNLREIHHLWLKTMKHEAIDDVVQELMRVAQVVGVMVA